ncbi:hypothetical protein [Actinacidiphila sp. bgisy160]
MPGSGSNASWTTSWTTPAARDRLGMKAALNGCLNLSVLDGWWDERCP